MQEEKFSMTRAAAFNIMPQKHFEEIDERLVKSMKHEQLINEDESEALDRQMDAAYGASELKNVFKTRYIRDPTGRRSRVVQRLDPNKLNPDTGVDLFPLDLAPTEKETDYVAFLQDALTNAERERTKYLPNDQRIKSRRTRSNRFSPTEN